MTTARGTGPALVLLTQTFPPDPAAVGQHMGDLAATLARRGRRVVVYASDRGYDDPSVSYARHEVTADGVEIHRLPLTSFGKDSGLKRMLAAGSFLVQSLIRTLARRSLGGTVVSTSPPFIGFAAVVVNRLRGTPIAYWAMDLNPEQLIALGKLSEHGLLARMFRALNRSIHDRASVIIALDADMASRLEAFDEPGARVVVVPPWSAVTHERAPRGRGEAFRARHGLGDALVVMYSGNHTPSNPLDTLLAAALELRDHPRLRFAFVGGGTGKAQVESLIAQHGLTNVVSLPYQSLEELPESLRAGDIHVVSQGDRMTGIIHPSKLYSAMSAGRPVLYFGPAASFMADLIEGQRLGWRVSHGDVSRAVQVLEEAARLPHPDLDAMGRTGADLFRTSYEPEALCAAVADAVESTVGRPETSSRFPSAIG